MQIPVKIFKKRFAELGEPNKLLLVAKLERPTFSCGIRKKMITIRNKLTKVPSNFNIRFRFFKKRLCFYKFSL